MRLKASLLNRIGCVEGWTSDKCDEGKENREQQGQRGLENRQGYLRQESGERMRDARDSQSVIMVASNTHPMSVADESMTAVAPEAAPPAALDEDPEEDEEEPLPLVEALDPFPEVVLDELETGVSWGRSGHKALVSVNV